MLERIYLDHQKMHLIYTDEKGLKLFMAILHVVGKHMIKCPTNTIKSLSMLLIR